jgi:hypothetical protein
MKKIIIFFVCYISIGSCQSDNNSSHKSPKEKVEEESKKIEEKPQKTEEELKEELRRKELEQFTQYLTVNATMRENLFGEKVIEGTISSTSTVAVFKDIVVEITFMSKTETSLNVQKQVLYEVISPNTKIPFKIKMSAPKATEKFLARVVSATPI